MPAGSLVSAIGHYIILYFLQALADNGKLAAIARFTLFSQANQFFHTLVVAMLLTKETC